jgi:indolepyruvate ferredoxin oxidoreductase
VKTEIKNGNELIVQGGLEAGFSLYTGYPGSPLADYFNILFKMRDELKSKGIKVVLANSEANAAAMSSGAKQANRNVLLAMKSMGLHVASDALSVGNFANPGDDESSGVVVVVGDDPWSMSTSTPADSRYLFKHLHIPFLMPSTPQELKDWIAHALTVSQKSSLYCGVLLTTEMAEGGGRVKTKKWATVPQENSTFETAKFDLQKNVMVPPNTLIADGEMINERFPKASNVIESLGLDEFFGNKDATVGVLSSGAIFETVKQVIEDHDLLDKLSILKLASAYPLSKNKLQSFLKKIDHLIIIEEKRGFLETEIKEFLSQYCINLQSIWGKEFVINGEKKAGFPSFGGLNFEIISQKIQEVVKELKCNIDEKDACGISFKLPLPLRLPTFCPGCPHRETLSLLKELRGDLSKKGIDLVVHGDVGCYSLSFLPPFKEMHNLSAMGQGGALGAGMDIFSTNPSVVLMGDSTFFHSGSIDISNSMQMGHSITYIILDNGNTAMTGHQVTPRSGQSVDGGSRPLQNIKNLVQSFGVEDITEVHPSDRYFYKNLLGQKILKSGVKVIISNKECALTFHGRKKIEDRELFSANKTQRSKTFYQIDTQACEDCRQCVEMTGCPGLSQSEDAYGPKITIDSQICVNDSYCTKLKVCPSFQEVTVTDYHPTKYFSKHNYSLEELEKDNLSLALPSVLVDFDKIAKGHNWHMVVTGVGGSGVTTIAKIIAFASRNMAGRDDIDFKFMEQKGLAQRNGNVTGHLALYQKGKSSSAITPKGKAQVLVSPDLLDVCKQVSFLDAGSGSLISDLKFQRPLTLLLDKESDELMDSRPLINSLRESLGDRASFYSFKDMSFDLFGKSVYATSMILGTCFQKGLIPFPLEELVSGIKASFKGVERTNNLLAFIKGRELVEGIKKDSSGHSLGAQEEIIKLYCESVKTSVYPWQTSKILERFFESDMSQLIKIFPEMNREHLYQFLHDQYVYNHGKHSKQFLENCAQLSTHRLSKEVKKLALKVLAKTYFVKDEIMVAHLLTSPLSMNRSEKKYKKLGSKYSIRPINRPKIDFLGLNFEFDLRPPLWFLSFVKNMRFLRLFIMGSHKREIKNNLLIRKQLLKIIGEKVDNDQLIKKIKPLYFVKGYREVRYVNEDKNLPQG